MRRFSEAPVGGVGIVAVDVNSLPMGDGARSSSAVSLPAGNGISRQFSSGVMTPTDRDMASLVTSIDSPTRVQELAEVCTRYCSRVHYAFNTAYVNRVEQIKFNI